MHGLKILKFRNDINEVMFYHKGLKVGSRPGLKSLITWFLQSDPPFHDENTGKSSSLSIENPILFIYGIFDD